MGGVPCEKRRHRLTMLLVGAHGLHNVVHALESGYLERMRGPEASECLVIVQADMI